VLLLELPAKAFWESTPQATSHAFAERLIGTGAVIRDAFAEVKLPLK
jgi:hypothetical protein